MKLYDEIVDIPNGEFDEEKLNEKLINIKIERVRLQDVRNYINRKMRELTRYQHLEDLAKECANMISEKPLLSTPPLKRRSENEGILMLSDLHIGLEIKNNWNKYNLEEMKKRLLEMLDKTVYYSNLHNVEKLNIVIIGDVISGIIHTTTRIENRESIVEQVIFASEVLSEFIVKLSNEFNINVYFATGNHGRIIANKKDSLENENFEHFIRYMMIHRCRTVTNINFIKNESDDDLIEFNCYDYKFIATHGDKFGNKNSIVNKLTQMVGYVPNYVLLGHYHHNFVNTIGKCEVIVNSSFSGTDSYAIKLGLISRPSQNLLIINKDLGKVALYHLYLD